MSRYSVLKSILFAAIALFFISAFQKDKLPSESEIFEELYQDPIQRETQAPEFKVQRKNITYTIKPIAEYELYGMVVSYFNSSTWWNIYHPKWKDYINKKDICVIWADNLKEHIYNKMKFKSTSFECSYFTKDKQAWKSFKKNCLSNNHLLIHDEEVGKKIISADIGDQIFFKGYLVEYSHSEGEFKRGTSLTRDDTGAWSCETVYVNDFKILKKANTYWRRGHVISKYLIVLCLILLLMMPFF
ncbi:MAG: hypothetical protein HY810_08450 [Candidatus Omnitrophica bacterium]|nr:hypothetical protein [Candidatus Omnitrophota bacterium]